MFWAVASAVDRTGETIFSEGKTWREWDGSWEFARPAFNNPNTYSVTLKFRDWKKLWLGWYSKTFRTPADWPSRLAQGERVILLG